MMLVKKSSSRSRFYGNSEYLKPRAMPGSGRSKTTFGVVCREPARVATVEPSKKEQQEEMR